MNQDRILENLNPEQRKAVQCTKGPLLVFAGAGSGKTRVITSRIAYLIGVENVTPNNIMAVTFTKKAAGEMQERVVKLLKELKINTTNLPTIGTFHSIGAMLLRQNAQSAGLTNNFSIYDSDDSEKLVKDIMQEMNLDTKQFKPNTISYMISSAKNEMISPQQFHNKYSGFIEDIVGEIYPQYQKMLKSQNAVDFGDLLYLTVKMLEEDEKVRRKYQEQYKYLLIDEYQDTNTAQYRFARLISDKHKNICVVGDDDQGIYAWRGADIKNIQSFEEDFENVTVIKLEQNYRSTANVIQAAVSVIGKNTLRVDKKLWTEKDNGDYISIYQARDQEEEAEYVVNQITELQRNNTNLKDIAILYRTNFQSRVLEEELLKNGLPYKLVGGFRFYERAEIKDILSYMRYIYNLKDELSLNRIINTPSRKVGPKTLAELHDLARKCHCTLGEMIVGAYALDSEYKSDLPSNKMEEIQKNIQEISKYKIVINTFGILYYETKGKEALEVVNQIIERTRYIQYTDDGTEAAEYRKENIEELKNVTSIYSQKYGNKSLEMFLQEIALIEQEQDKNKDGSGQYVNLMTLHSSKGLEFDNIFIVGLEEGILPHSRSFTEEKELEEERRLCYVGITRAREKLFLTFAQNRLTREGYNAQIPSRFLGEIPEDICEYYSWDI